MHFGGMFAYSIAFAAVRHSLKEPPQPGIIVSPARMFLATAVPGTRVTSAGEIPGIPGGNSSPAYHLDHHRCLGIYSEHRSIPEVNITLKHKIEVRSHCMLKTILN